MTAPFFTADAFDDYVADIRRKQFAADCARQRAINEDAARIADMTRRLQMIRAYCGARSEPWAEDIMRLAGGAK